MAAPSCRNVLCFYFLLLSPLVASWDDDDLELFDLVEEVNQNFYELMGVDQDAKSSDIRRAYRKLSLQLHPDKNKEDDAEIKFRQLVAVHDVLKDEVKRQKYESILIHGLPDWRQPVYYYRKVRKMGLLEMSILLTIIITVGQYLVVWSVYFEKKFTIEEVLSSKKKKDPKSKKAKQTSENIDNMIEEEISAIPKPKWQDLLPFRTVYLIFHVFISIPRYISMIKSAVEEYKERKRIQKEEAELNKIELENELLEAKKPKKKKTMPELPEYSDIFSSNTEPVIYQSILTTSMEEEDVKSVQQHKGEWSDEELSLLIKGVAKFPGGTVKRWEKIAEYVGRSANEVVAKTKEMKSSSGLLNSAALQGTASVAMQSKAFKKGKLATDQEISQRFGAMEDSENSREIRQRKPIKQESESTLLVSNSGYKINDKPVKLAEKCESDVMDSIKNSNYNLKLESQIWSQNQQKILEWALIQYPKGPAERWEKIAEHIPGKNKEDCIVRFKYLAELVKKRKQNSEVPKEES